MVEQLQELQQAVGPAGSLLIPLVVGFLGCACLYTLMQRKETASLQPDEAAESPKEAEDMKLNWEKKDSRRARRRAGRIIEVLVALPGETDSAQQALVLNRSVGGLGLLIGNEYPVDTVLGVLPANASQIMQWVEVTVKSCRKHGDDWELGVQFLKVPPYATMLMFG